jgi:hypothetical protein
MVSKWKIHTYRAKHSQILFGIRWNSLDNYDIWNWAYDCDNYKKWKEITIYFLCWYWNIRVYYDPYIGIRNCTSAYYCMNEKNVCEKCRQETLNLNDVDLFDPDPERNEINEDE